MRKVDVNFRPHRHKALSAWLLVGALLSFRLVSRTAHIPLATMYNKSKVNTAMQYSGQWKQLLNNTALDLDRQLSLFQSKYMITLIFSLFAGRGFGY